MADKKTILIIDDELDLLNLIKARLEYYDYEILHLSYGKDAVETVQAQKPDLVILDVMIPDKNGYDICNEIKHNSEITHIPVIIFTAKPEWKRDMDSLGRLVRADDYIAKPFDTQLLVDKIRKLLEE